MQYKIICDNFFDGKEFKKGLFLIKINGIKIEKIEGINHPDDNIDQNNVLDLRGKIITPGIIDSHNHFTMTALKMRYQIDLGMARSITDVIKILEKNVKKTHKGWLLGYNLNEFNIKEGKLPNVNDLNKINFKMPIFITHFSEHYAVCNLEALKIAKIDNKNNPLGGVIERDESGNPTGILYEPSAMDLVKSKIPEYSLDEYEDAISYASDKYLRAGITAVKDIGGTGKDINEELRIKALNNVNQKGNLKIKVGISIPIFSFNDINKKLKLVNEINNDINLKFTGFKVFLDGSGLSRNAWMKDEWNKNYTKVDKNNFGHPLWDMEEFKNTLEYLSQIPSTISIHAIGDRAVEEAINYAILTKNKARYAIVHCTSPSSENLLKIKNNEISIETQGSFIYFFGDDYKANFGKKREKRLFPFMEMIKNGVNLCNGSDSPVTPYKPIYGIISTVSRQMKTSKYGDDKLNPCQSINLEETLQSYTYNCSMTMGWESIGSLQEGKIADIIAWNIIPVDFKDLPEQEKLINLVIYNGNIFYG